MIEIEYINKQDLSKVIEKATATYSNELTRWMSDNAADAVINYLKNLEIVECDSCDGEGTKIDAFHHKFSERPCMKCIGTGRIRKDQLW